MPSAVAPRRNKSRAPRSSWIPDALLLLALAALWIWLVLPIVNEGLRGYDIFRDIGNAVNIQHGRYVGDPAYPNETFWYPPLSPVLVAGISALLDAKPADCYRWSQLLVNGWIPIGLFLIVRIQWGRRAAILGHDRPAVRIAESHLGPSERDHRLDRQRHSGRQLKIAAALTPIVIVRNLGLLVHVAPDAVSDEFAHDAEVDVGLKQGNTHFAHSLVEVALADLPARPEPPEGVLQSVGECVEHWD